MSLAINDLPDPQQSDLGGTLKLGNYTMAGRLSLFKQAWSSITTDQWVLEIVSNGYAFTFYGSSSISTRAIRDVPACHSSKKRSPLDRSPVPLGQGSRRGDSSRHKRGGGVLLPLLPRVKGSRRISSYLNLRGLNAYLLVEKFRMETLASILRDLQQGMWMISLDLKDAYLHVPIIPLHRKFLRFALRDQQGILRVYQWAVLPFGLASAPRVCTKMLAPIAAHLHLRNMSMYPYIDDIFHAQISRGSVILTRDASVCLHLQLGFVINLAKSSLIPSQVMTHLGAWIDTLNGWVRPSQNKVQEINQVSADLLANGFVSAGRLQSIVGLMAACYATVPLCLFRLRPLSSHLSRNFKWRMDPIQKIIPLDVPEVLGSSRVLVGSLLSSRGSPSGLSAVRSNTDDGRLQLWLGGSPRWQPLLGKVDSPGVTVSCEYPRTNGSPQSDPPFSGESPGRSSSGSDGQHYSPVLSEPEGGGGPDPSLSTS